MCKNKFIIRNIHCNTVCPYYYPQFCKIDNKFSNPTAKSLYFCEVYT